MPRKIDIIERLDGPHEWGYRGLAGEGFIHDPAPNNAAREIGKLRDQVQTMRQALINIAHGEGDADGFRQQARMALAIARLTPEEQG